jgi:hypothetical protein
MEIHPEALLPVAAIQLGNGVFFHAKMIGLDRFLVPEEQARKSGFLLAATSKN